MDQTLKMVCILHHQGKASYVKMNKRKKEKKNNNDDDREESDDMTWVLQVSERSIIGNF